MPKKRVRRRSTEEGRLRGLLELAPDAMVVVDQAGVIVLANAQAEGLFGYRPGEVLGKQVETLIPQSFRERHRGHRFNFHSKPRLRPMGEKVQLFGLRKNGTEFPVEISLSPVETADGMLVVSSIREVSERKMTEESRLRLAAIVESSEDAIIAKTVAGLIVSWNKGAEQIYGYTEAEAVGKPITIIVPPELREEENQILARLGAGERIEQYEIVRVTKSGKRIRVSTTISPIKDSTGKTVGISGISRDITARKLAQQALRKGEERLRLAAQAAKMYSFEWDVTTDAVLRSPEHVTVLGATKPLHLTHSQFIEKIHPDDRPKFIAAIAGLTPEKPSGIVTYRLYSSDGALVWLRSSGRAFFDREGKMLRVIGMAADVTDQKLAEEALRASEERLRLAQQVARIGTFERDVQTERITWTEGLESLYGLPPGSVDGKTLAIFKDLVHPADRERIASLSQAALKTGQPTEAEWRAIWPDGSVHWLAGRWQALMDDSGAPARIVGVNMDVTERKLAEQALHAHEELLKTFVKNVPAAVAMLDRDMHYLQVSDRWCSDYLPGKVQIVGLSHYELFPDMPERWKEVHRRALGGETLRAEEDQWYGHDGAHWARWEVRPWHTPEGTVGGILILAEDITRRKQMEEALSGMTRKLIESQEQERARIGRELHDNISQQIAMLAVELEQLENDPSGVQNRLQELRKQMSELSNDVQALSHELHSSKLEYLGVVSGMRSWCREFGERQNVAIEFKSDVSSVVPFEIGINLFRVLQEAVHNVVKHSGMKRIEVLLREGSGEIQLIVRDSGRGFDVDAALQGKGLGLTSMRERVRLVNGTIAISSKPMGGTTIHVRVPFAPEPIFQREAV